MLYLSAPPTADRTDAYRAARVGVMLTPNMGNRPEHIGRYPFWAADNGCFSAAGRFDLDTYLAWLDQRAGFAGTCLFATAPDVLCDAAATWERSAPVFEAIRERGYYVALVGQNGLEEHAPSWDNADLWDWLFLGGDDAWKDGEDAAGCVHEAQLLGKAVHVGRVNTRRRFRIAAQLDADSADGMTIGIAPGNLDLVARWLPQLDRRNGYAEQLPLALI
jgi:hypothetical protein